MRASVSSMLSTVFVTTALVAGTPLAIAADHAGALVSSVIGAAWNEEPGTASSEDRAAPSPRPSAAPQRDGHVPGTASQSDPAEEPTCEEASSSRTPLAAPAQRYADGAILGTTGEDLTSFAERFNALRAQHCLESLPLTNFRHDPCLEERLVWMAEDPSRDPASAWGHDGAFRSDGAPIVGCDGNLAGGAGNTGAVVAQKWWDSAAHRAVLYRPDLVTDVGGQCVGFAMTHGGLPDEPADFTRAAAVWGAC